MNRKALIVLLLSVISLAAVPARGGTESELSPARRELWLKTKARLEQVYEKEKRVASPMSEEELDALRFPARCGEEETVPLPWDLRLLMGFDRNLTLAGQGDDDRLFRFLLSGNPIMNPVFTPDGLVNFLEDLGHYGSFYPLDRVLMRQAFLNRGRGLPVVLELAQLGGDELPGLWLIETPSGNTPVLHYEYDDYPPTFYLRSTSLLDYAAAYLEGVYGDQPAPAYTSVQGNDGEEASYYVDGLFIGAEEIKSEFEALKGPLKALNAALEDTCALNTGTDSRLSAAGPEQFEAWFEELKPAHETSGNLDRWVGAYRDLYAQGNFLAGFFVEYTLRYLEELKAPEAFSPKGTPRSPEWAEINRRNGGLERLEEMGAAGNLEAENLMGLVLNMGLAGRKMDRPGAVVWLSKAAERGHAGAQNSLGAIYHFGWGVEKSLAEAVKWYRRAAEQGKPGAMVNLANLYLFDLANEKHYAEGLEWLRKAAELDKTEAQYLLAGLYYEGRAVKQDYAEAARLARLAAEKDFTQAQALLGQIFYQGALGEPDFAESFRWLDKAAKQGDPGAMYLLGAQYIYGLGVVRDTWEGLNLMRRSAEKGLAEAQIAMGGVYEQGVGSFFEKDLVKAAEYYQLAADQGYEDAAQALKRLKEEMEKSPAELGGE